MRSRPKMIPPDVFNRIPSASSLLILTSLLTSSTITTEAHVLPRQTKTIPHHSLDVRSWPLQTAAAVPSDQLLAQRELNTVCGYVGGDPDLPATCSAGSHCVVDTENSAIGCCPDGGTCTSGVYTSCVDGNSDPQNEVNPYVYTCSGGDVCYKNSFGDGYFQYGCGSSSDMAATVAMSASGKEPIKITSVSVDLTEEPTSLSEPTTLGTRTGSDTSTEEESATAESETSGTRTGSPKSTGESDPAEDEDEENNEDEDKDAPEAVDGGGSNNTAPIVGGTVGGIAFLALAITLGLYFWRRRKGNTRDGPGGPDNQYVTSPMADARHPFSPLHSVPESEETHGLPQDPPRSFIPAAATKPGEISSDSHYSQEHFYQTPSAIGSSDSSTRGAAGAAAPAGGTVDPHDRTPLASDFPQGHADEYYERPDRSRGENGGAPDGFVSTTAAGGLAGTAAAAATSDPYGDSPTVDYYEQYRGPRRGAGGGALWQQNRRQNRNLTWM